VPTIAEYGFPGFEVVVWFGLLDDFPRADIAKWAKIVHDAGVPRQ
jgi:tripartite-type tricarboxylate transporter receptor subunit TctC